MAALQLGNRWAGEQSADPRLGVHGHAKPHRWPWRQAGDRVGRWHACGCASSPGNRRAVGQPLEPASLDLGSRDGRQRPPPARQGTIARLERGCTPLADFSKNQKINTLVRRTSAWLRKLRLPKLSQIANVDRGRGGGRDERKSEGTTLGYAPGRSLCPNSRASRLRSPIETQ
jgi:hypothetical protein